MKSVLFVILILTTSTAHAFCFRCRRSRCVCPKQVIKTAAVPQSIQNIIVQSNVPAAHIAGLGSTGYTYGTYSQPYALDPNLAAKLLSESTADTMAVFNTVVRQGLLANKDVADVAKLQTAVRALEVAQGSARPKTYTLRAKVVNGELQIIDQEETTAKVADSQQVNPEDANILTLKCGKCHGKSLTKPKAGLILDSSVKLGADKITRALRILSGVDVPDAMSALVAALDPQEKADVMAALLNLEQGVQE